MRRNSRNRTPLIIIFVLLAVIFVMFALWVLTSNGQRKETNQKLDEYAMKAKRSDSIVSALRADLAELRKERGAIISDIAEQKADNERQKAALDVLNYNIFKIKQEINANRPNYTDSTINAINNNLPK